MFNRTWRIVLLVAALVTMIWPTLLGSSTGWISLIAVALLLISELSCNSCEVPSKSPAKKKAKKRKR